MLLNNLRKMKKYYTLLILLLSFWSNAQNGITYQAVILNPNTEELPGADNSRLPLVNQKITLEFKILNATSNIDYQETINTQTDAFGMVNVIIGTGTRKAGIATQFSAINWDGSPKTLIVALDPTGDLTHFIEISNQPFTYVPYALYAAHTGVNGTQGPAGSNGLDGKTVLNGTTNPNASIGTNGDFYINTTTNSLFGPKANGLWGNGVALVGPQGIQGPQGNAGTNGTNGLSAYQIWLNAGNTGTEAQFVTALRGAAGAQGPQGIQGVQGPTGLTGATGSQGPAGTNGINGTNGSNGLSAYQVWLNAGNTGTEAQFLTALRGATGAQGPQGIQGIQGATGTNGKNTLVNTTTEAAGANCATGGTKIEVGIDANSNGILDSGEVNSSLTKYVCNGNSNISSGNTNSVHSYINLNNSGILSNWTIPNGVYTIEININGSIGGNGGTSFICGNIYSTGIIGGQGGDYGSAKVILNVNPGDILSYLIGTNGLRGSDTCSNGNLAIANDGTQGQTSSIYLNGNLILQITGGTGGTGGRTCSGNSNCFVVGIKGLSGYLDMTNLLNNGFFVYDTKNIYNTTPNTLTIRY
jgi:Collagen triple helix repeat (20 copies)